jgi:hypothetical protein
VTDLPDVTKVDLDLATKLRWCAGLLASDTQEQREVIRNLEELAREREAGEPVRAATLAVVDAAWGMVSGTFREYATNDLIDAVDRLGAAVGPLLAEPEWKPGTWGDVITGDRVRLNEVEAEVESACLIEWKKSGSSQMQVRLKDRPALYSMPPAGPVEILRGPAGQAVDESGVTVVESWGGDAVANLEAAGMRMELISRD